MVVELAGSKLCCSEEQVVLLVDYALYLVTCLLLWYSRVLLPLKLFTVFLHELSHAMAVWLTCNKVIGIEVNANQGGLTHWTAPPSRSACARCVVLPAGYLGSAAWGGLILVCCVTPRGTQGVAIALIIALLVAFGYALFGKSNNTRDWTLVGLCVGMLGVLAGLLYLSYFTTWRHRDLLLSRVLLLLGTMNTLFATYDIWEDCIARTVEGSDAYKYAELVRCAAPKCIGVIWFLFSLVMAVVLLAATLSWTGGYHEVHSTADLSSFSWLCIAAPAAVCASAIAFRLLCSTTYNGKLAAPLRSTRGVTLEDSQDDDESLESARARSDDEEPSGSSSSSSEEACAFTTGSHAIQG